MPLWLAPPYPLALRRHGADRHQVYPNEHKGLLSAFSTKQMTITSIKWCASPLPPVRSPSPETLDPQHHSTCHHRRHCRTYDVRPTRRPRVAAPCSRDAPSRRRRCLLGSTAFAEPMRRATTPQLGIALRRTVRAIPQGAGTGGEGTPPHSTLHAHNASSSRCVGTELC
jgi:hypothetical protein